MKAVSVSLALVLGAACAGETPEEIPARERSTEQVAPAEQVAPEAPPEQKPPLRLGDLQDFEGRCGIPEGGFGDVGDKSDFPATLLTLPESRGVMLQFGLSERDGSLLIIQGGVGQMPAQLASGSYKIQNPIGAKEPPGVLLRVDAEFDPRNGGFQINYLAVSGTLELELVEPEGEQARLRGAIKDVTFERVVVDHRAQTIKPANDECKGALALTFDVPLIDIAAGHPMGPGGIQPDETELEPAPVEIPRREPEIELPEIEFPEIELPEVAPPVPETKPAKDDEDEDEDDDDGDATNAEQSTGE